VHIVSASMLLYIRTNREGDQVLAMLKMLPGIYQPPKIVGSVWTNCVLLHNLDFGAQDVVHKWERGREMEKGGRLPFAVCCLQ